MTDVALEEREWPALEALAVSKRFGRGQQALAAISLTVPRGSIVGLVGPNAAGKSTLIRTWVGFERPSSGSVRVCGFDPQRQRAEAVAHLAYVAQSPMLYRELTAARHLDLALAMRKGFDREVGERRLADLDIPIDAKVGRLSGGQAAQVSLAIALGTRADVLLLDEPLASLDPLARREFLDVLSDEVHAQGGTALLSSHVVADVERACDRIIALGTGRVLLDAPLLGLAEAHRLYPDGEPPAGPHLTAVGRVESGDGWAWLAAVNDGSTSAMADKPSVEQVVLAYLASGRHPARRS